MTAPYELKRLSSTWRVAAEELSFRIEAPYSFKGTPNSNVSCVAFLPDFGGPKGMVVDLLDDPPYERGSPIRLSAEANGMFCSFINPKVYEKFDAEEFKEALTDWGFFGPNGDRPNWML